MKTAIKSTLKRLINGPRTEKELTCGDVADTAHQNHTIRRLNESEQQGYCVFVDGAWQLTNAGRDALAKKKEPRFTEGRICAGTATGTYSGHDLRRLANRSGCYDFLDVPSLMHYGLVYRKDANPKVL